MALADYTFRTTDLARWGTGKGSNLSATEGDANVFVTEQRLTALEENPPTAVGISNILVSGTQLQIVLSNGDTFGPFTLPTASMGYRESGYLNGDTYRELDLVPVPGRGLYVTIVPTYTAPSGVFDPNALDDNGDSVWKLVFGEETYVYDFSFSIPGKPGVGVEAGSYIASHLFMRDVWFDVNFVNCIVDLDVAPTDDLVYEVVQNSDTIGTLTFPTGVLTGVYDIADQTQFSLGDRLRFRKISDNDATAEGLSAGFAGTRGLIPA